MHNQQPWANSSDKPCLVTYNPINEITCDVLRFIFQLDEEASERIETICGVGLIARAISEAVANSESKFVSTFNKPELKFVARRL